MAAVVAGGGYAYMNRDKIPQLTNLTSQLKLPDIKQINASDAGTRISAALDSLVTHPDKDISAALDSLVTHPDKDSPVVLGVKITNESIGKLVDVIQGLPPEQVNQIKQVICAPASPSGNE